MNRNHRKQIAIGYILFILLFSLFPFIPSVSALIWNTGVTFNCDNEYYSVTTPLTLDNISVSTHWFSVNGIGFNITETANSFINFSSIKSYPKSSTGWILNWTGQKYMVILNQRINGLKLNYDYILYTNATTSTKTSTSNGSIWVNQTVTTCNYKIYDPSIPAGWFVSLSTNVPAGNDSNSGTILAPFATLRKAINASTTSDTIYIRGGNYQEPGWNRNTLPDRTGTIIINRSGTYAQPFTISNWAGEKVVIDGQLESIAAGYGMIRLYSSTTCWNNITFTGINFSNCSADCIYGAGFAGGTSNNNITIQNCEFFHIFKRAVYCLNSNYPSVWMNNIYVKNCKFKYIQDNSTTGECISFIGCRYYSFENSTAREFVKQFINAGGSYGNIRFNSFENKYYFTVKFDPGTNGDRTAHHINVYGNVFFGTAVASTLVGIYFNPEEANDYIHDIYIYNNLFNITTTGTKISHGIAMKNSVASNQIEDVWITHNTIYCNAGATTSFCLKFWKNTGTIDNIHVGNNIFINSGTATNQVRFEDFVKAQTNVILSHNLYNKYGGATIGCYYTDDASDFGGATNISDDPDVHARATGDFDLNVTSPAIDVGTATYGASTDYAGNTRPQFSGYDIGAYEYSIGGSPPSPSFLFSSESPTNNSVGVAFTPTVSIHIHEIHGYLFNYTIRENHTVPGVWTLLDSANNQGNGTYTHTYHPATDYTTYYGWQITAVNGTTWHNESYYFTTTSPVIPAFLFSAESPANTSIGVALTPTTEIHIHETHGFRFNYSIRENTTGTWIQYSAGTYAVNSTVGFIDLTASAYSTRYWWRVIAWNGTIGSTAVYHNETYYFTTMAAPPPATNVTIKSIRANWTTDSSIYLQWDKGAGCTDTKIYKKNGGYPLSITDPAASLIYFGPNTFYNDTLLSPTVRYYYRIYAYDSAAPAYGNDINVTLAETENTTITTSLSALFKGWLGTDKNIWTHFLYSNIPSFGTVNINVSTNETGLSNVTGTSASTYDSIYDWWIGQVFKTFTDRYYLNKVSIKIKRVGNPGPLFAYIYSANGSSWLPTGAVLSSGSYDSSTIGTTGEWINITMSSYYFLTNTRYCVVFDTTGSSANKLQLFHTTTTAYNYGQRLEYNPGVIPWRNSSEADILFNIWGVEPTTYPTGQLTSSETISTTGLVSITQSSLNKGTLYYYRELGNDSNGNMTRGNTRYTLTNPEVPVFLNIIPYFDNNSVKITWIKGTGANRTVVVRSNIAYPTYVADGVTVYNDTGSLCWVTNISFNTTYYFSLFSYTTWAGLSRFSSGVHIPWGGVTFIVYNESRPWQVINASMIVTDSLGFHPVQFNNIYGYYSFNISQIPYGENTLFYVSNTSYHSRLYPITIIPNIFYNFSFYLPPITRPIDGPPGENITGSYMVQIKDDYQVPVPGALVKFYLYFNTTANFTYIGGFVSDGNGQGSIDLYPYHLYLIKITCDGYDDSLDNSWTPNAVEQGLIKVFEIYHSVVPEPGIFDNLIVSIEPEQTNFYDSFTAYFNITSSDAQLMWMTATMSRYNSTTVTWSCLFSQNTTTTIGGSISYVVPNVTGVYQWSCSFGKTGFSNYTIVKAYSILPPINISDPLDALIKHVAGRSPIYIPTLSGETVASWSALIASFVAIFVLFGFSPKFSGLAVMSTGAIMGVCKSPLGIIPNGVLNWIACGFIIILGILMVMADKKEGGEQ